MRTPAVIVRGVFVAGIVGACGSSGPAGGTTKADGSSTTGGAAGNLDAAVSTGGVGGATGNPDAAVSTGGAGGATGNLDAAVSTGGAGGTTATSHFLPSCLTNLVASCRLTGPCRSGDAGSTLRACFDSGGAWDYSTDVPTTSDCAQYTFSVYRADGTLCLTAVRRVLYGCESMLTTWSDGQGRVVGTDGEAYGGSKSATCANGDRIDCPSTSPGMWCSWTNSSALSWTNGTACTPGTCP